jgi:hypothetical protein
MSRPPKLGDTIAGGWVFVRFVKRNGRIAEVFRYRWPTIFIPD